MFLNSTCQGPQFHSAPRKRIHLPIDRELWSLATNTWAWGQCWCICQFWLWLIWTKLRLWTSVIAPDFPAVYAPASEGHSCQNQAFGARHLRRTLWCLTSMLLWLYEQPRGSCDKRLLYWPVFSGETLAIIRALTRESRSILRDVSWNQRGQTRESRETMIAVVSPLWQQLPFEWWAWSDRQRFSLLIKRYGLCAPFWFWKETQNRTEWSVFPRPIILPVSIASLRCPCSV